MPFQLFIGIIIVFLTIRCSRGAAGVVAAKTAGIRSTELKGGGRDGEGGVHNGRHGHGHGHGHVMSWRSGGQYQNKLLTAVISAFFYCIIYIKIVLFEMNSEF